MITHIKGHRGSGKTHQLLKAAIFHQHIKDTPMYLDDKTTELDSESELPVIRTLKDFKGATYNKKNPVLIADNFTKARQPLLLLIEAYAKDNGINMQVYITTDFDEELEPEVENLVVRTVTLG